MNILKLQDQLKGLPDNTLVGYVQNPTGQVPTYLALSELQRRKEMRSKYQEQAATPQQSVADELVAEATQPPPPPPGVVGLPQAQPMMQAMAAPPEMPVQQMAEGGLADLDVGDMFNEQSYAGGGIVAFAEGGDTESSINLDELPSLNLNTGEAMSQNIDPAQLDSRPYNREMEAYLQMAIPGFARDNEPRYTNAMTAMYDRMVPGLMGGKQERNSRPANAMNAMVDHIMKKSQGMAQGGEVQHFVEGGTSRLGRWWEGYKQRGQENLALEDEIQRLQNEYYSLTVDPLKKTLPGQPEAAAQRQAEIKQRINELKAAKSGAVSKAPTTIPGANVMGSQAAADKMFGTQYDPSQSIGYKGAPAKEAPSAAIGSAYNDERVQSIGDYAKELQDFLGPDKNAALQRERLAKMDSRVSRMDEQAPWLALLEAGLGTMAGTSPFALTNIGAGAQMGVKSYANAQDRLATLEERRMILATNIDQAERREKLAVAEFGAKSKEAAQERKFRRQLQREHDATLKQMNTDDNLKALQAAMIKNQPSVAETLKVKEYVDQNMPQEEKLILKDLGGNSSDPESKNFSAYTDRMKAARLKLEREAVRRPGIPEVSGGSVTNKSLWGNLLVN